MSSNLLAANSGGREQENTASAATATIPSGAIIHEQQQQQNLLVENKNGHKMKQQTKPVVKLPRRSKDSLAFHRDPFNRPELVHTLRGRELILFGLLYVIGLLVIVVVFETVMPVFLVDEHTKFEQRRRAAIVLGKAAAVNATAGAMAGNGTT